MLQPLHHWVDADCGVKVHNTNKYCVCVSENAADVCWVCWKSTVVCAVPSHTTPVSHISKQRAPLPSRLCFSASSLATMDIDVPW